MNSHEKRPHPPTWNKKHTIFILQCMEKQTECMIIK